MMMLKYVKFALGFSLIIAIGLALIQGCGEITGSFHSNEPPVVEIVNVPPDAYGSTLMQNSEMPFQVTAYDTPTLILSRRRYLPNTIGCFIRNGTKIRKSRVILKSI